MEKDFEVLQIAIARKIAESLRIDADMARSFRTGNELNFAGAL